MQPDIICTVTHYLFLLYPRLQSLPFCSLNYLNKMSQLLFLFPDGYPKQLTAGQLPTTSSWVSYSLFIRVKKTQIITVGRFGRFNRRRICRPDRVDSSLWPKNRIGLPDCGWYSWHRGGYPDPWKGRWEWWTEGENHLSLRPWTGQIKRDPKGDDQGSCWVIGIVW